MNLRPETPADYPAVNTVHIRAFGGRLAEALIVALHRERARYDAALSVVAELDGKIVGHALFSPQMIRLMDVDVLAVNLAPIGIDPAYQKRGVGAALMREGHRIAQQKGYALCFLLGHTDYYPRFGYRTGAYGVYSVEVDGPFTEDDALESRMPQESDIPDLLALWRYEQDQVDFAVVPGESLLDWISPNPLIKELVYTRDGRVVGYARIGRIEPANPGIFLAADAHTARGMAADMAGEAEQITLPLHPASASARVFDGSTVKGGPWNAAMVCPLNGDGIALLDAYFDAIHVGQRSAGQVIWPTLFDLA